MPFAAMSRMSCVIFIEQNFGPHIEQKCATLCASFGSVSSWKARAVSGSSERLNWSSQRNSKRAREVVSSRSCLSNDTATTEIYTLSLHYALPICVIFTEQNFGPRN